MLENKNDQVQRSVYTVEEIGQILGVSIRKAYSICEEVEETKEFKVMRLGKRCVRVHKQSFDNWLATEEGCSLADDNGEEQ